MLKSHRDLEGVKICRLYLESGELIVSAESVQTLRRKRLIETNHKFPAAAYLLTEQGAQLAAEFSAETNHKPLTSRKFAR